MDPKTVSPAVNATPAKPVSTLLLNLPAAAEIVGLTTWQLRGLIALDEIPVVRVGKKLYLHRAALIRWADRAQDRYKSIPLRRKKKSVAA